MASIVSIIPIVLLFILMLGFKMAGHKSALLTLVVTVLLALFAASPLSISPEIVVATKAVMQKLICGCIER